MKMIKADQNLLFYCSPGFRRYSNHVSDSVDNVVLPLDGRPLLSLASPSPLRSLGFPHPPRAARPPRIDLLRWAARLGGGPGASSGSRLLQRPPASSVGN
jgi:hypothetical protein